MTTKPRPSLRADLDTLTARLEAIEKRFDRLETLAWRVIAALVATGGLGAIGGVASAIQP